jgi:pullulanase
LASTTDARAYWLNKQLIKFPKGDVSGVYKLYHSGTGQIKTSKEAAVSGASLTVSQA